MKYRALFIFTMVLILMCLVGGGYVGYVLNDLVNNQSKALATETAIRNELGNRLGVDPNWDAIERHIFCKFTSLGRLQTDVENDLLQVDVFKAVSVTSTDGILYVFSRREIYTKIYGIYVLYDSYNRVADAKIRETQGPLESYTYKQFDCTLFP